MLTIEVILLTIWQHGIADTAGSTEKVVIETIVVGLAIFTMRL
jgi:hypothetical protein